MTKLYPRMARSDITDKLIHFTTADSDEQAFETLQQILTSRCVLGGTGMIKGKYQCVCLTEAPLEAIGDGRGFGHYRGFGVMFDKSWIFDCGGRPVVYQPDDEFFLLPENLRWRHVIYNPTADDPVDFTWEREWRVQTDELHFEPEDVVVVVPDNSWEIALDKPHDDWTEQEYALVLGKTIAQQYAKLTGPCPWRVVSLN